MQTFDQSLFRLLQSGIISLEEAMNNASNPDEFKMRVQGIYSRDTVTVNASSATAKQEEKETIFVKH